MFLLSFAGVSCHSELSEISCDYAIPPDDVSSKSDSECSEPEQKILKYATDSRKHVCSHNHYFLYLNIGCWYIWEGSEKFRCWCHICCWWFNLPMRFKHSNIVERSMWTASGGTLLKNKPHLVTYHKSILVNLWTFKPNS